MLLRHRHDQRLLIDGLVFRGGRHGKDLRKDALRLLLFVRFVHLIFNNDRYAIARFELHVAGAARPRLRHLKLIKSYFVLESSSGHQL